MPLLAKWHPWNPGYALPANVLDEPPDQNGAMVTAQAARGTISAFKPFGARHPWSTGYAIPGYINAERPGGPVTVTPQAPRGTIAVKQPGVFMKQRPTQYRGLGSFDGGSQGSLTSFGEGSLGATDAPSDVFGTKKDPILQYGAEAARIIVTEVRKLPAAKRKAGMKEVLDAVDPALWIKVEKTAEKYANLAPQKALEKALTVELSNSMAEDLVALGRQGQPASLDGWFTDARKFMGRQTTKVGSFGSSVLGKLGSVACKLTNSGILGATAGAAGMASGGPTGAQAGMVGAQIAGTLCAPSPGSAPVSQQQSGMPSWVVPAAIGGGVLILVLALRK